MAYADQTVSNRRIVSIIIVALIHAIIGYAFITGLGTNFIKKAVADLKTFDVKDEPPPPPDEPPPPPPPEQAKPIEPPPLFTPQVVIQTPSPMPQLQHTDVPRPVVITPEAPKVITPPSNPISQAANAIGDERKWISTADYPPGAQDAEKEGVVKVVWDINEQGRMENCRVVESSGTRDLDLTTCRVLTRRARYVPAKDASGNPIRSSGHRSVRWVLPEN